MSTYNLNSKILIKIFFLLLLLLILNKAWAPARMHKNTIIYPTGHKYETKEKYEVCRLSRELRKPTEIKCYYTRQDKNGSDLIITNDQPTFSCLKSIKCKRE